MEEEHSKTDAGGPSKDLEEKCPSAESTSQKKIELHADFSTFLELRSALERYQKENSVQLIVKDSKLLKAESTRKIIPKVYHLVNQDLMYHSITYCCKCHGELKQKPGTRLKNVGQKRLNCPMYIRFKLSPDLQKLVLFDINEEHNHGIDPTTFQMTPRQQVYKLSRMKRSGTDVDDEDDDNSTDVFASVLKNDPDYRPPKKSTKVSARTDDESINDLEEDSENDDDNANDQEDSLNRIDSPLDSETSCSDSEEEERALLPFPIRLIGSAIRCSPELLASTKQLIEIQKTKLLLEKQKLQLQTKHLELMNNKLLLELRSMERNMSEMVGSAQPQDTTIYLQAT